MTEHGAHFLPGLPQVIAFSDEEGVRFQTTFLGSAAVAGILPESILQVSDKRLPFLHKPTGLRFENGLLMQSICCMQLLQWHYSSRCSSAELLRD